jgi:uncharacterized protein
MTPMPVTAEMRLIPARDRNCPLRGAFNAGYWRPTTSRLLPACLLLALLSPAPAAAFDFTPLGESAWSQMTGDEEQLDSEPWVIPEGFRQRILSDERDLDLYHGSDWTDMQTLNETGPDAGRFLYRTHEVRRRNDRLRDARRGGAVSVVDLETGKTRLLATRPDWHAVDGILWTPWGTLLVTEEQKTAGRADPDWPHAVRGLVYEILLAPGDPSRASRVVARPLLGSMTHEGIEIDERGNLYVVDESRHGAIYRFVPDARDRLDKGRLEALRVTGGRRTGPAEWVPLHPDASSLDARKAASAAGATGYCRPEDIERIGNTLYVAVTCEESDGAVLSVQLGTDRPRVAWFVKPGENVARESALFSRTGLRHPDNLADGPGGRLWIAEDNVPGDIWVAEPDRDGDGDSDRVSLFASLRDIRAEPSGIYFGQEPLRLFVAIQHSATGNDKTVVIDRDPDRGKEK